MSESEPAHPADGQVDSSLRDSQLRLMLAVDELILDPSNTLAGTLQFIVTETRRALGALHVDILFAYPDGCRIEISSNEAALGYFVPFEQSIQGLVLSTGRPVLVNDIQDDPVLGARYFPRVEMDPMNVPSLSVLAAGITLDGEAIGVINVEATADNRLGQAHLDFVKTTARHVSMAISHAALFDEDNFRTATDRLLVEAASGDSDLIMRQVLDRILSTLNFLAFVKPDAAEILFADPQDGEYLVVAHSTNRADVGVRVEIGTSVCGDAFRTAQTVILQRAFDYHDFHPVLDGMRCEMAIPIIFGGGSRFPIGVLNLESARENAFSNVGRTLAERFALRVANAIAMTKIRADIDSEMNDQLMVVAADQVLNAVHRINNYVGSIRALAIDLLDDLGAPDQIIPGDMTERLQLILQDADRALKIPDVMRKRIGARQESVNVNEQVRAGIASVRIPEHITLATDLAEGLPNIPCTALDLVVENLLLNAVSAMRDRPGPLRVSTWLDQRRPREPFIVITVQDAGVGMTQYQLDHLFEPRQPGRRGGGLGFGMMWVRSWVRRAHGLIEVDSEPGLGTTVNIRFQIDPLMIDRAPEGGE